MRSAKRSLFAGLAAGLALLTAGVASAFTLWPYDLPRQPNLYRVLGYLDAAPDAVTVRDRVTIRARGHEPRQMLVTDYGVPGEMTMDMELSRAMGARYTVNGTEDDLTRLFSTPPRKPFVAFVVAYTNGPPSLTIGDLQFPDVAAPESLQDLEPKDEQE